MLQLRNTPDFDMSPAKRVFGHPLRDAVSFVNCLPKFTNRSIRRTFREAWRAKEDALRLRSGRNNAALRTNSRPPRALHCGDRVFLQNQTGNHPRKWDNFGTVTEVLRFDQYVIKVDGSERISKRNKRFLRLIPQVVHDTSLFGLRASLPYPLPTPPDVSTHSPAAHKSLQDPRGPATTCHYKPPANHDDDSEPCSVPSVDSSPELNESPPVVLNELLHLTDVDGPSECPTLRHSSRIRRPALK